MIDLSLPLHVDWMGGLTTAAYLDRLVGFGITAVEVQLPPEWPAEAIERWTILVHQARERRLKLAIHAPMAPSKASWPALLSWIVGLATAPLTIIVHGCTARRPTSGLAAQTIVHVHSILAAVPPLVTVAVEQGWNWGRMIGFGASIRRLHDIMLRTRGHPARPTGVGSGMGAAPAAPTQTVSPSAQTFDPQLGSRWRNLRRVDGFSGTSTREETLQVVMEVNQPNCMIAWDVAHDWLGSAKGGVVDWRSTPSGDFLDRVGYVRLHDVDGSGRDHWPLVIGNVPYTSQLRSLLRHGFTGTVCLAIRYTSEMQIFGDRWHVLERSLAVTRQVLRLN